MLGICSSSYCIIARLKLIGIDARQRRTLVVIKISLSLKCGNEICITTFYLAEENVTTVGLTKCFMTMLALTACELNASVTLALSTDGVVVEFKG